MWVSRGRINQMKLQLQTSSKRKQLFRPASGMFTQEFSFLHQLPPPRHILHYATPNPKHVAEWSRMITAPAKEMTSPLHLSFKTPNLNSTETPPIDIDTLSKAAHHRKFPAHLTIIHHVPQHVTGNVFHLPFDEYPDFQDVANDITGHNHTSPASQHSPRSSVSPSTHHPGSQTSPQTGYSPVSLLYLQWRTWMTFFPYRGSRTACLISDISGQWSSPAST